MGTLTLETSEAYSQGPAGAAVADEAAVRRVVASALRGRFRIVDLLGQGGMSIVYGAEEVALGRRVALKVMLPAFASELANRERFRREARVLASCAHTDIAPVYALGDAAGLPWFTMRRIDGESLAARLERGSRRMPLADACEILATLADALHAVHRAGIVHRDIKPANVVLEAPTDRPVLIDFGVALVGRSDHSRADLPRGYGTLEYMCPEQALGEVDCDLRGDIYSLGVVGFRMLTGRLPFPGGEAREIIAQHVALPAPRVSTFRPEVPPAVDAVIARCLAKAPADRWPNAASLRDACRVALARSSSSSSRGLLQRLLAG